MRLPRGVRLILAVARLVAPRAERQSFAAEWSAELLAHLEWRRTNRSGARASGLYVQAVGALSDAAWRRADALFGGLLADVRFGIRGLVRRPSFALLAVATVGLGIGATSAIYTLVDGVVLRPLPYASPHELVAVHGHNVAIGARQLRTSEADFVDYAQGTRAFASLVGVEERESILRVGAGDPVKLIGADHTGGLFETLGIELVAGRTPSAAEHAERAPVVVISPWLGSRLLGDVPEVIGAELEIDAVDHVVIGVVPENFDFPERARYWTPTHPRPGDDAANASGDSFGRDWRTLRVIGRLHEGTSVEEASADVQRVAANLEATYPTTNTDHGAYAERLHDATVKSAAEPLMALLAAVAVVLAITCANVGGLLLARAAGRRAEIAVRAALGAGRRRVVRLLLTESLLLALVGGGVGLLVGRALLAFFLRASTLQLPRADSVSLDLRVILAMVSVMAVSGIVCGLAPAIVASRRDLREGLCDASRATAGPRVQRLLQGLVVAQVALSTVLVVAAALFATSFARLLAVDHGYSTERLLTFQLNIGFDRYPGWDRFIDFFGRSREAVAAIPGVERVEHINMPPLRPGWQDWYHVEGTPELERGARPRASLRAVTPGFFDLAGLALRSGRGIRASDTWHAPGVAVVNETFARRAFPDADALGQRLEKPQFWGEEFPSTHEIVGIVQDSRSDGLAASPSPTVYFPFEQVPFGGNTLFVRTALEAEALAPALRGVVTELDPLLPVEQLKSVDDMVEESAARYRFAMLLSAGFGLLALTLANVGLYGVLSYSIAERTAELGLRQALGADAARLMRDVLGGGVGLAALGIAVGMPASFLVTRGLESAFYEVTATDPRTYLIVAASMGLVALLASWMPAARAVRVHPLAAMTE